MQRYQFDLQKLKKEIPYQGNTFTVVRLTYDINGHPVIAEGISRRSHLDRPDPELGISISEGRAMKALAKKLNREIIHHKFMG